MVLRAEAVRERLLKLEEVISRLERMEKKRGKEGGDFRDDWARERGLQLGAETILDIGNHILSAHFGVTAVDHEDILTQLHAVGVIDDTLSDRLKGIGGFRNILVDDYLRLDSASCAEFSRKAPRDFGAFAGTVRRWLENTYQLE